LVTTPHRIGYQKDFHSRSIGAIRRQHCAEYRRGNGKFSQKDRARFFQIAHGSALESAACLDLLVARGCCTAGAIAKGKAMLEEIVKMLFKMLDQLGCRIAEDSAEHGKGADQEVEEEED
jgi:four helix bundle protein